MGYVHADVELINGSDCMLVKKHMIGEEEVKRMKVRMMVDSGCYLMAINEVIQSYLQLDVQYQQNIEVADGRVLRLDVVGPIETRFSNRRATCNAYVLPGNTEPLLGAIPMEEMDVLIDPKRQELVVNPEHPDFAVHRL